MAERDDALARRYRDSAREEPPAALDAAILAASRRAVGARPGGARRWAGPLSIAAVLVLGIGLTLRMQHERPGIETSAPMSEYQMPAPEPVEPAAPSEPQKPAAASEPQKPAAQSPPATPPASLAKRAAPARERAEPSARNLAPAPAAAPVAAATAERRDPAPEQSSRDSVARPSMAPRAKLEASTVDGIRGMAAPAETPVEALERIARLRAQGRHAEADKALEEFRRRYPEHRIPADTWERVKPR